MVEHESPGLALKTPSQLQRAGHRMHWISGPMYAHCTWPHTIVRSGQPSDPTLQEETYNAHKSRVWINTHEQKTHWGTLKFLFMLPAGVEQSFLFRTRVSYTIQFKNRKTRNAMDPKDTDQLQSTRTGVTDLNPADDNTLEEPNPLFPPEPVAP